MQLACGAFVIIDYGAAQRSLPDLLECFIQFKYVQHDLDGAFQRYDSCMV